ncbi:MAG: epoxyqueuosine reductase QueH [Candidatus Omnitrophica bacterium]|nr:epoxyqueuosine reductase QueH [Candidatus Omnitrophota bacterium]
MKLLLHSCCAPCSIYPLEQIKAEGLEVEGIFYNPNIHPLDEYNKRRNAMVDFSAIKNLVVSYPEYLISEFMALIQGKDKKPERCFLCWKKRMEKTAKEAKAKGFDFFTTTLLVSPYQDHDALRQIGNDVAKQENVNFYYQDFRKGFRLAQNQARASGLYRQKYCGCLYSLEERCSEV